MTSKNWAPVALALSLVVGVSFWLAGQTAQAQRPASKPPAAEKIDLPKLPGIEQLRRFSFPELFELNTLEKGPKAYLKRNLDLAGDRAFIFLNINEQTGAVSVDTNRRDAWKNRWMEKGASRG